MAELVRGAGLLIYRKSNSVVEFLLLQASYEPYHWTPPKGHVDPGEDEWMAAIRETKEEASIEASSLDIDKNFCHEMRYQANNKPKKVTYWLARIKGDEFMGDTNLSHEHQKSCWAKLGDAIALTKFPEMEKMLKAADEYLENNSP